MVGLAPVRKRAGTAGEFNDGEIQQGPSARQVTGFYFHLVPPVGKDHPEILDLFELPQSLLFP